MDGLRPPGATSPKDCSCGGEATTDGSGPSGPSGRGVDAVKASEDPPRRSCTYARSSTFERDSSHLAEAVLPSWSSDPLVAGHLGMSFDDLSSALTGGEDGGPGMAFLREALGCFNCTSSPWVECFKSAKDTTLQRCQYSLPLPGDVPESAARLLGIGKSIPSSTMTRLRVGPEIIMQQITRTEGLLYSERMCVMNTHVFQPGERGGVAWRTWNQIVWLKPLPWTHSFISRLIESRVKADTKEKAPKFMAIVSQAAAAEASEPRAGSRP